MPVTDIKEIRILPPLAIARLGSSPDPMDNYDLVPNDATGFHTIAPASTLQVDPNSGEITGNPTPSSVNLRDSDDNIRPVAPFFEVWAIFEDGGSLQPLTEQHLSDLGLSPNDISWRVRVANIKAFRRTGDENDKVEADTGEFNSHGVQDLDGACNNFKSGANPIRLGHVRYIKPTPGFPEIRLRFTPAAGKVYGPDQDNVITAGNDVYDPNSDWKGHRDGTIGTPPFTNPGGIYANLNDGVSLGYLDDACDGVVSVKLTVGGNVRTANSRVSSGPPDFAPDCLSVRTVADDLEQMLLGPDVNGPVDADEVIDIVRRAVQTIQLMSTDFMNISGMASHDNRTLGRASEPIFQPQTRAAYPTVRAIHLGILNSLSGLHDPAGSPPRLAAVGALQGVLNRLREFDSVGDLSNDGRQKMPALMRGSDGLHLALTRRQRDKIEKAIAQFGQTPMTPNEPAQNMLTLIATLSFAAGLHSVIPVGDGRQLSELFADPPQLLDYLRNNSAKGSLARGELGKPLVVPGDPDQSAIVGLISNPQHPMHGPFSNSWVPVLPAPSLRLL